MRTSGGGRNEGYKRLWERGTVCRGYKSGWHQGEWEIERAEPCVSYSLVARVGFFRLPSMLYGPPAAEYKYLQNNRYHNIHIWYAHADMQDERRLTEYLDLQHEVL